MIFSVVCNGNLSGLSEPSVIKTDVTIIKTLASIDRLCVCVVCLVCVRVCVRCVSGVCARVRACACVCVCARARYIHSLTTFCISIFKNI